MGIGVSGWRLARAVSIQGQLGVVSGTAIDAVVSRKLQLGDPGGAIRQALKAFPSQEIADRVLSRFYIHEGKKPYVPFRGVTQPSIDPFRSFLDTMVAASFADVYLAKKDHDHPVGINLLEKIQLPTPAALYGAMLAGVDYVLMGAGIPKQIPGLLQQLAEGEPVELRIDIQGGTADTKKTYQFDPSKFLGYPAPKLKKPRFFAIVSSAVLAENLLKKSSGIIDGFVVEGPLAGGHNAPPRGPLKLSNDGEPIYGPRDAIDPAQFKELGLPFWLAGGYGRPGKLEEALACGANGIQVGTAFAFCEESELRPDIKAKVLQDARAGTLRVFTDPYASPTGFPFKIVQLPGSLSDPEVYEQRERVCDIGLLRQGVIDAEGILRFRCPSEPTDNYLKKEGCADMCEGRQCLCNGLLSGIGLGQVRGIGEIEPPLVTAGDDVVDLHQFLAEGASSYTAADVIERLMCSMPVSI